MSEEFVAHQERKAFTTEAYNSFMLNSKLFYYLNEGGTKYLIRAVVNADDAHHEDEWPRAWVQEESQIVNAAVWVQNDDASCDLVALWTFSPGGDETSVYMLEEHKETIWAIAEKTEGGEYGNAGKHKLVDKDCYDAFSCSSGDNVEENFHCFALEGSSPLN